MTELEEVPGALERPGDCRIVVGQREDGTTRIEIPPRRVSFVVYAASAVLLLNLLLGLYMGAMLLFGHRSVLYMAQVAPGDLPRSMWPYEGWMALGAIGMEALGFWALTVMLRPLFLHETLTLGPTEFTHTQTAWGRTEGQAVPRGEVRGFQFRRDPQGFSQSVLTLQTRGEPITVAEQVAEADREWLASVCQAVLRRL